MNLESQRQRQRAMSKARATESARASESVTATLCVESQPELGTNPGPKIQVALDVELRPPWDARRSQSGQSPLRALSSAIKAALQDERSERRASD